MKNFTYLCPVIMYKRTYQPFCDTLFNSLRSYDFKLLKEKNSFYIFGLDDLILVFFRRKDRKIEICFYKNDKFIERLEFNMQHPKYILNKIFDKIKILLINDKADF